MSNPKLTSFVLFVNDVAKSKDFYVSLLGQEVAMDINNINVGFKSGLALWDKAYATKTIFANRPARGDDADPDARGAHDELEIYFETVTLDDLFGKITGAKCELVHGITTQPWQQRVFRFRDPDGYIVEIGEAMEEVVKRLLGERLTIDEISAKTFMPKEAIQAMIAAM